MSAPRQLPFDFHLQNEYIFANYFVSTKNAELIAALHEQATLTEQLYYVWGSEGSGKSHVFQALCQQRENAVYIPLKKYLGYGPEILLGLENMDIVCFDDIECVVNKREWEEALFHFFNASREQGKRLLVSAMSSPRNVGVFLPDLHSRLNWGVVYQLHQLSEPEKISALKIRAQNRGIPINDEVLNYIMLRSPRSMVSLFDVLDKLDQLSLREQRKITIPFVKEIMGW